MSLIIKAANTMPITIEIDVATDVGRIKGNFTGHARIFGKKDGAALSAWIDRLANWVLHLKGLEHDALTDEDRSNFGDVTLETADEALLRRLYVRFEGLGNESGPLDDEAAWHEVLYGQLSATLYTAALEAFWRQRNEARAGNARPSRAR